MNWIEPWHEFWVGSFWILPLLMVVVMLVGMVVCVRMFLVNNGGPPCCGRRERDESPMEIAERRYANGEVNKDEFDEIKNRIA